MIYPIIIYYKVSIDFKCEEDLKILNSRNIIIVIHSFVFTLVQFYLEQPILQTINSCGPIFIFVIDYFMNGVKINQKQFFGVLLAIFGVLLTVNGEALTSWLFSRS
jgi:drug/metabolite transporter (DMT)-like permease